VGTGAALRAPRAPLLSLGVARGRRSWTAASASARDRGEGGRGKKKGVGGRPM